MTSGGGWLSARREIREKGRRGGRVKENWGVKENEGVEEGGE